MGLSRGNGNRFSAAIWPGFVDAMTALLMVMMFVLTIFLLVQSVLRDQITTQDSELDQLGAQVAQLSDALALSQDRARQLDRDLAATGEKLDAAAEQARLEAARRAALEALTADLRRRNSDTQARLDEAQTARQALDARLNATESELAAMTMELESARKQAQETLTLLAAADAARKEVEAKAQENLGEAQRQAALLAVAQQKLTEQQELSAEDQRRVALLNQQVAQLNSQLGSLREVLASAEERGEAADVRIKDLGQQLNLALLRASEEERKRRALEEAARQKAEAEARDLARYRSEFFGRLSQILAGREGVRVVGDRFAFSSEVLFAPGEANLSTEGRAQIARVADSLRQIVPEIPPEIDWIIRVDGHTDDQPLSGQGRYRDNRELSQARALAVVRYMVDELGFPAERLLPTGFADTRPVVPGTSPEARAQNRRIELKLTER
ncbi:MULTISPECIES: peptidoglycan -binding protein [unclassified Paracoccus (in: a-proteobacteria)]|uniref:peptidoglycan -binding protein n=1 Tax=unclassified Paracoccus (in: a-proteobacteria) TaxID=2688777 RepID=UPI0012B2E5D5|nr:MULTISPECIES: peptidoglycan -binding protein [unclassified Paracoccus (in: a-proteobacteria)]UXU76225.1 peptidoglycan -binding protein [Paracoccus sp. SMMA_5]UXU82122.1 peptidoglycan -binding protein [Paracoccus sp. SMMA_5_TC]